MRARLVAAGIDLASARRESRYIELSARDTAVRKEGIALLCGYPRLGQAGKADSLLQAVRVAHRRTVGWPE